MAGGALLPPLPSSAFPFKSEHLKHTQVPCLPRSSCPTAGGYTDIVEMLLDAAPETVDRGDAEGDTPLHNAARGGHAATLRALLARGADATLQNDEFKPAAQLTELGSEARQVLEEAARQAAEAGQPQGAAPLAEVA